MSKLIALRIDIRLDSYLREYAKKTGRSITEIVLAGICKEIGVTYTPASYIIPATNQNNDKRQTSKIITKNGGSVIRRDKRRK